MHFCSKQGAKGHFFPILTNERDYSYIFILLKYILVTREGLFNKERGFGLSAWEILE